MTDRAAGTTHCRHPLAASIEQKRISEARSRVSLAQVNLIRCQLDKELIRVLRTRIAELGR